MNTSSHQRRTTTHPSVLRMTLQRLQPGERAGTIYDRDQRRRPYDRRQQRQSIIFDMRVNKGERRQRQRRAVYDPGRRNWPEPPTGINVWA